MVLFRVLVFFAEKQIQGNDIALETGVSLRRFNLRMLVPVELIFLGVSESRIGYLTLREYFKEFRSMIPLQNVFLVHHMHCNNIFVINAVFKRRKNVLHKSFYAFLE